MSLLNTGRLFPDRRHTGVRAVITGQVGVEKKPFCERVAEIARAHGKELAVAHVGDMMYREAPDVVPGRILDLPRNRLDAIRRSVFKDILRLADKVENLLVNTHATFRWKHGLFPAFDHDQLMELNANLYFTLVDNVDSVHQRLVRDHDVPHSLKDILVWREEEVLATEILSRILRGHGSFYVIARGVERDTAGSVYRLMFEPQRKRVYPSFPMTHVMDMPGVLAEIDAFRDTLAEHFITFDPGDLDEKRLLFEAGAATQRGEKSFSIEVHGQPMTLQVDEVTAVAHDIDAQIYARDFKLIDQSDMIVSYVPEMPNGKPGLSSGVERELHHAYETTKEVYVVWKPKVEPSPFVTKTANDVFPSVEEALKCFQKKGYLADYQLRFAPVTSPRERGRHG
ncbi:MAG TPA: AAA family ATPase [Phycisphaerae bacterium]|jgi:adenylate kinase|nr:AAA family ATPase [Phycisphaerae bacterium]HOB74876.1 AAA family ATPase [Phycisphaerae bacterium]HOJ53738.1 AAA family ATPase [Phycisphaerae bacterium]HOL27962.1 AAA family ATPase [Phycisphaerae bacterium]HPP22202.1 AAA family ATPase [Phycisphaerae bacterium]